MRGRASEAFAPESSGSLIDAYLPSFQVREYHETRVQAEPAAAYAAFLSLDLNRSRIVRLLFAIRTLPSRLLERGPRSKAPPRSFLEDALAVGWKVLAEAGLDPNQHRNPRRRHRSRFPAALSALLASGQSRRPADPRHQPANAPARSRGTPARERIDSVTI